VKRICILTQNHISKNPRVLKEAIMLIEAGYSVSVLTTWHSSESLALDEEILKPYSIQYRTYSDLRPGSILGMLHRIEFQISRRVNFWGFESLHAGGYGSGNLVRMAIQESADLYLVHQEIPTLIAPKIQNAGFKVAFDFEDWYSRDLPEEAQRYRPVKLLAKAENWAIQHGLWCTTTSASLANALGAAANSTKIPVVIYNAFSLKERDGIEESCHQSDSQITDLQLAWISQTVGPGRGLEEFLLQILPLNIPIKIHLAGELRPDFTRVLHAIIENAPHIQIQYNPSMPPNKIVPWLNNFDAGIAPDIANSESRELTVTNKILHYLLAGIPVIASKTKGHEEIAEACPDSVCIVKPGDTLLKFLQSIHNSSSIRAIIRQKAWEDGRRFSWETQKDKFLLLVQQNLL